MEMIPYSPGGEMPIALPHAQLVPLDFGEFAVVHICIEVQAQQQFIAMVEQWFDNREEVIFVGSGVSSKEEIGYVVLEWEECQPDTLFLRILDTTEFITDYSVYVRSEED
jgi:hypothetical protein